MLTRHTCLPLAVLTVLAAALLVAAAPVHLEALLAFKKGVTADPLGALSDWTVSAGDAVRGGVPLHCNWTGVACDGAGRVTSIQLLQTQLQGALTPFLGNISTLQLLDLTENGFTGAIPPQLGRLSELQQLILTENGFAGGIPPELGDLGSLQLLDLANNSLSGGIPSRLCNCSAMWALGLGINNLTGQIPSCIGDLNKLQIFSAHVNNLDGELPPSFAKLTQMKSLATTSSSSARAAARPLQGDQARAWEPSSGGSTDIVLPSPMRWRGRVLSQLEDKRAKGCPKSHDHNTHCSSP